MQIGKTLYVKNRDDWREWLEKHHETEKEIWLVFYNKASGKPSLPYNDAVEEALCFGWIDSIVKKLDNERRAQRFSPRKANSPISPMNLERMRRMKKAGLVTEAGLATIKDQLDVAFVIAKDIEKALKKDKATWENFQKFPESYKRIRIGWIEWSRPRPEVFKQRLDYFIKMTAQNKRYGMVQ